MRTIFLDWYDNLSASSFSIMDSYNDFIFPLKVVSVVISILFLTTIVFLIAKLRKNIGQSLKTAGETAFASENELPRKEFAKSWQSILSKVESQDENSYKIAVIEADKMLDDVLKRIGCAGADMGERLKQVGPHQLSNIDDIWQAHKARNRIAHEPDFRLTQSQAKRAVEIFQRALEDLQAI
ncbi:MAG: hypothetical protein CO003_00065 [Candidatus Portnoybacteria bacterium CG_4_8_14_3_um_filter_44_15]|uniref:Uncharacterized protein n=4 Tax=Candidatus Portnoyibacteriota TaxID=1817913 RepID=A0A2M7YME3_9BACT|nr:MAG: hypothetical protein COX45_00625 [Candidatus Portnoybacteria bacterium CG23_combo_of_CG06-09_8_20_14_all_44_36]PIW74895.1 MAG: hypothetical protein CO003_00065 [Candidatus Portnoybacteria bacterium CG_4_8_14_3_um_filter_44_15]PIZ70078.1 MAG: hypothetical protein COY10_00270 [Candidatus Portnoybacteria bacterium CG_4_10_14_0_2_um_filter_43_36]PJA64116.1 MAG: hypothetical protein CO160_00255 [Candidatus Portnoybacteria bacterium CG_4_9_14_3_um_filter_43_11]PJE59383.1 MAG: hypothetical pro